jgi:IclR family transcriptional regulator, KDG regulon repressor
MPKGNHTHDRNTVQSVERSLDILEELAVAENGIGIIDLSSRVSLHASTVHRLLATLVSRGYVRQDNQNGRYILGRGALALAQSFHARQDIRNEARPFLQQLMEESGETANLIVLDSDEAVYIDQVPSSRVVRMFAAIGKHAPLHSTGCGKLLLAYLDSAERARIISEKGLPASTRYTITSPAELERDLAETRRRGFAVDNRENDEDVRCIAGPVRDHSGRVVAAISISGPATRFTREQIPGLSRLVVSVSTHLSEALGYKEPEPK